MDLGSRREKFNTFNTLCGIPVLLQGKNVLIDLRNETSIAGRIAHADGYMNIVLEGCVFIDQKGLQYEFDQFMVTARKIRQIHIPNDMNINIEMVKFLDNVTKKRDFKKFTNLTRTNKMRRTLEMHRKTLNEIQKC